MKLAIMQPYLFPYIGYYQLVNAVDKFIVYDDVNFIKQGWINRNTILGNSTSQLFTVPLENVSSFVKINETKINLKLYPAWSAKFLKTIGQNYSKAPFFDDVFPIIKDVIETETEKIADIAVKSIQEVCMYLQIDTIFGFSSANYENQFLSSQNRIIDICKTENTDTYINLMGGITLYDKETFAKNGIALHFIKSESIFYRQFSDNFVPNLSIIDLMMFNDVTILKQMLNNTEFL